MLSNNIRLSLYGSAVLELQSQRVNNLSKRATIYGGYIQPAITFLSNNNRSTSLISKFHWLNLDNIYLFNKTNDDIRKTILAQLGIKQTFTRKNHPLYIQASVSPNIQNLYSRVGVITFSLGANINANKRKTKF